MNAPQLNLSDAVLDEVLQCLSRGHKLEAVKILRTAAGISLLKAKQVADRLLISAKTADHHVQHIYTKIGASTRGAAALFAIEHGILPADD